jgi:hypothetical protein
MEEELKVLKNRLLENLYIKNITSDNNEIKIETADDVLILNRHNIEDLLTILILKNMNKE